MPPPSFLTLPRELRHQIITEAYHNRRIRFYPDSDPGTSLPWALSMKKHFPHTQVIVYAVCSQTMRAVDRLTRKLMRVHKEIVEDIEFVRRTLKWIVGIEETLEELELMME